MDSEEPRANADSKASTKRWKEATLRLTTLSRTGSGFSEWLRSWRNISSDQDPEMTVHLRWISVSWFMALVYIWCRLLFYTEDFISLRQQPADVYIALNQFLPFIN